MIYNNCPSLYWGENDSNIIFCENKYLYSQYISEYTNTISNILYIVLPILLLNKHPEKYYLIIQAILIGLASGIFHATSRYYGEILDESFILLFILSSHLYLKTHLNIILFGTIILLYIFYLGFNHFILFHVCLFIACTYLIYRLYNDERISKILLNKAVFYLLLGKSAWIYEQYIVTVNPNSCNQLYFLHSVWHIFSAISVYYLIRLI